MCIRVCERVSVVSARVSVPAGVTRRMNTKFATYTVFELCSSYRIDKDRKKYVERKCN